jgi:hypothetical protein
MQKNNIASSLKNPAALYFIHMQEENRENGHDFLWNLSFLLYLLLLRWIIALLKE